MYITCTARNFLVAIHIFFRTINWIDFLGGREMGWIDTNTGVNESAAMVTDPQRVRPDVHENLV